MCLFGSDLSQCVSSLKLLTDLNKRYVVFPGVCVRNKSPKQILARGHQSIFYFIFSSVVLIPSPPPSSGGQRRNQWVCRRWCQIFRIKKYTKGGEKHRQEYQDFILQILIRNNLKPLCWKSYHFRRTDKKEIYWNGPQRHPAVQKWRIGHWCQVSRACVVLMWNK